MTRNARNKTIGLNVTAKQKQVIADCASILGFDTPSALVFDLVWPHVEAHWDQHRKLYAGREKTRRVKAQLKEERAKRKAAEGVDSTDPPS